MIAHTLAVKMDAKSGNLMEIMVSDRKTVEQATEIPIQEPFVKRNVVMVHVLNFHE